MRHKVVDYKDSFIGDIDGCIIRPFFSLMGLSTWNRLNNEVLSSWLVSVNVENRATSLIKQRVPLLENSLPGSE